MSCEFRERKRKSKSCKKKLKSNGRSGEGSSSRNDKKIHIKLSEEPAPPLPIQFKNAILALVQGGNILKEKSVIQKQLFPTDMAKDQNRLPFPVNQIRVEFLSNEEMVNLPKFVTKGLKIAMEAMKIEPLLREGTVELRRWGLKKYSGRSSLLYVLNENWETRNENNKLEVRNVLQLWAVRIDGELLSVLLELA